MSSLRIGIIGANGFTGQELTFLLSQERRVKVQLLQSRREVGQSFRDFAVSSPVFTKEEARRIPSSLIFENLSFAEIQERSLDCIFFCTPHGIALQEAEAFLKQGTKVIDLSGDFRFFENDIFEENYGIHHFGKQKPSQKKGIMPGIGDFKAVYGLSEVFPDTIKKASLVANPGCYVTSILLAVLPIAKMIKWIVADAKSGYSGAGVKHYDKYSKKMPQDFFAYNPVFHRHQAEIQQFIDLPLFFTPHLLSFFRGIESTCHCFILEEYREKNFFKIFQNFYQKHNNIIIQKKLPPVSQVQNTNICVLGGFEMDRQGRLVISSVLDNLRKGAASQAVQNFNLLFPDLISEETPLLNDK